MTTRVPGSSARISRHASTPEPSGSRTSMTTMSGLWRRACSSDSSTVPASATTWKFGRRSSSATSPCRTTSWSSTTSSRSGRSAEPGAGGRSAALASGSTAIGRSSVIVTLHRGGGKVKVMRVPDPGALRISRSAADGLGPRPHVAEAMVARPEVDGRIEADAVVRRSRGWTRRPTAAARGRCVGRARGATALLSASRTRCRTSVPASALSPGSAVGSRSTSTSTSPPWRTSSASAARPGDELAAVDRLRLQPVDEVPDVADREIDRLDRGVDAFGCSSGFSVISSSTSSSDRPTA